MDVLAKRSPAVIQTIKSLLEKGQFEQQCNVYGWVRGLRKQKNVAFMEINDGSTSKNVQIVCSPNAVKNIIAGASVHVNGKLVPSVGIEQKVEVHADWVSLLGDCNEEYPIQKKDHGAEFLRRYSHLKCRTSYHAAIARVRSAAAHAMRSYFLNNQFVEVHAPVITFSDCEGAGESFEVRDGKEVFGRHARLTVSAQLHAEIAASSLGRVFTFGPIFRAEKHNTSRHLSEFWMLEPEVSFIDDLSQLTALAEDFLQRTTENILVSVGEDLDLCWDQCDGSAKRRIDDFLRRPLVVLPYKEAITILEREVHNFTHPVKWGLPLQTEHERFLAENYVDGAVAVTDYPVGIKSFYMRNNNASIDPNGPTAACFDLLLPGIGEVIGGSLREERLDVLEQKMAAFQLLPGEYQWYLDLRRYGSVPHGGFGLGFERYLQFILGIANIRDVCLIPRIRDSASY